MVLPLAFPAVVAGSIFTFSLTLGDYITPELVSNSQFIGNVIYDSQGVAGNMPFAAAYAIVPGGDHGRVPARRAPVRRVRRAVSGPAAMGRRLVGLATIGVLAFLYIPIVIIFLYSFNADRAQTWPITTWTTSWFGDAFANAAIRDALRAVARGRAGATALALVLGSLAAFAVHRFRFFGRETISFLLVLPLALPGIVTGMALNATFNTIGIPFSLFTIVVGHATFCVVVVYNNVIARLRRSLGVDRGGVDGPRRRHVADVPATSRCRSSRTALLAGGLLAFALSFDEVIVTTFTAGHPADAADLDPREPPAAQPAAAGQRGRGGR